MSQRVLFSAHSLYSGDVTNNTTPTSTQPDEQAETSGAKKPYEAPALVRWGTLHELTKAVGSRGASDHGNRRGQQQTSW
jgi:hypothetical protein